MEKEKNEVLEIIINFVKACKKGKEHAYIECDGKRIWSANYLLNQILRQYYIDDAHILVSKKAQELWNQIAEEKDIKRFTYRQTFTAKIDIKVDMYFGAKKDGVLTSVKKGQKVVWNNIFHDEHTIPIKIIIKELCMLEDLSYENVSKILDKIYICKMLKEEDRKIIQKSDRPSNVIEVVEKIYNSTIEIYNWSKIKKTIEG